MPACLRQAGIFYFREKCSKSTFFAHFSGFFEQNSPVLPVFLFLFLVLLNNHSLS